MPTYEYECKSCKNRFEEFQSINDDPIKHCPRCGKSVRRLFGGGMGIIFKGSGFYTTDYKRSSAVTGGNGSPKTKETKTETETKSGDSKNTSGEAKSSAGD